MEQASLVDIRETLDWSVDGSEERTGREEFLIAAGDDRVMCRGEGGGGFQGQRVSVCWLDTMSSVTESA